MLHKHTSFTHIKSWASGLLLLIVLCCAYQPVFARTADFRPARQGADLSNALLRLEDLPKGFAPLSGRELDSMESAVGAIGKQISGASGASLVNFSGFRTGGTQNPQIVVSGLITPLSAQLQSTVDRAFGNPDLVIRKLKDQLGGDETSELPGYEAIGTTSLGFITNTMGFRMEYVVAHRGPVLIEVANLYRQGEKPLANTIELARLLDNRVADVVGRESGTQFRPAGPTVPELTTYIPTPLDISTRPGVLGANLLLAALLMLPFAVAAELFTRTLGEHEDALQRFRPLGWVLGLQNRLQGTAAQFIKKRSSLQDVLKLVGVMVFYGLVFSLLDRTWKPFSLQGLILFLSMVIAYGVIGIADDIIQWRAIRKWGLSADLSVRPSNFLLALASTATSRLLGLVPGLMFGTPEALQTEDAQFDEPKRTRLLKISARTLALVGLGVWLMTAITSILQRLPLPGNALNLIGGLEGFLLVIFAVALENLFVQMLGFPGGFGQALKRRSKWLWLAALAGVTFFFYHTLINPRGELAEALQEANIWLLFGIAVAFMALAFGMHFALHRKKRVSPLEERISASSTVPQPAAEAMTPTPAIPPRIAAPTQMEPVYISINATKQCPVCCNPIKAEARICRYCRATYNVTMRGYCMTDHAVVVVTGDGKCSQCGSEVTDLHVESLLLKAPAGLPVQAGGAVIPAAEALMPPAVAVDTKLCPVCGRTIKAEARLCRFCRTNLA